MFPSILTQYSPNQPTLYVYLSIYLSIYRSIDLFIYSFIPRRKNLMGHDSVHTSHQSKSLYLSIYLSIYIFIYLSVYLSIFKIYQSINLSIYLSIYWYFSLFTLYILPLFWINTNSFRPKGILPVIDKLIYQYIHIDNLI